MLLPVAKNRTRNPENLMKICDYKIAPICAGCIGEGRVVIDFAKFNNISIQPEQKNLARWHQAVSSRPSAAA